jgi:hypothetical protein
VGSTPEIAYLAEAICHTSDLQVQTSYQVKALISDSKIKTCRDHEEDEGRINTDLLSRFIIVGGPLIQPGPNMQDQLVRQVRYSIDVCLPVHVEYFQLITDKNILKHSLVSFNL